MTSLIFHGDSGGIVAVYYPLLTGTQGGSENGNGF